jgi:hypothetical protein
MSVTPSGIKTATFRILAQYLNQLYHRVPHTTEEVLFLCSPEVSVNVEGTAIHSLDTGFHGFLWLLETPKKSSLLLRHAPSTVLPI